MTPLFTVHAGEYLVGSYIEEHFKRLNIWVVGQFAIAALSERRNSLRIQDRRSETTAVQIGGGPVVAMLQQMGLGGSESRFRGQVGG
jgi:hypothetical protein